MLGNTPIPLIEPVISLLFKSSCSSDTSERSWVVKLPVKKLKSKSKKVSFDKDSISVGIVPVRFPLSMPHLLRSVKRPTSVGIVPRKLFLSVMEKDGTKGLKMK